MDRWAPTDDNQDALLPAVMGRTAWPAWDLKIWEHSPFPSEPADSAGGLGVEFDAG